MGRTAADNRKTQLETLRPQHRAMARAMLAGALPKDLAIRYGMTLSSLTRIINSPLFKLEYYRLENSLENMVVDEVRQDLESLRPRAVEVIAEELVAQQASARRTKCAFDLLDRTDFYPRKPESEQEKEVTKVLIFAPLPGEDPEIAKERLKGLRVEATKKLQSEAIDAEFEGVFEGEEKL